MGTFLRLPARRANSADTLSAADMAELRRAVILLEENQFLVRMTTLMGNTVGHVTRLIPAPAWDALSDLAQRALIRACDAALATSRGTGWAWLDRATATGLFHKAAVVATGAGGGVFGLAGAAVELPVTTTLLLRAIVQVARAEGEDLDSPEVKAECLKVFALGSPSPDDDGAESGYYVTRLALAEAVKGITGKTIGDLLPTMIAPIAARFGLPLGIKLSAEALPVLGAASGAAINLAFAAHFQNKARGHFVVRRLERAYGADAVRAHYEELVAEWRGASSAKAA